MGEIVILGFGSNLGNRYANLKNALKIVSLHHNINLLKLSDFYETQPWGYFEQKNFINFAAAFWTNLHPLILLKFIKHTEIILGRNNFQKWMPRKIDIDILFYGNKIFKFNKLIIPHPLIQFRNFVLFPLMDLIPDFVHPVLNKKIKFLFNHSGDSCKIKKVDL
jgi:2-amino-4-hydroxy-6-hydroxymethyldihydropteridine diphosphokinase